VRRPRIGGLIHLTGGRRRWRDETARLHHKDASPAVAPHQPASARRGGQPPWWWRGGASADAGEKPAADPTEPRVSGVL